MKGWRWRAAVGVVWTGALVLGIEAQQPAQAPQQPVTPPADSAPEPQIPQTPHGTILFQRHAEGEEPAPVAAGPSPCDAHGAAATDGKQIASDGTPEVTDKERAALTIRSYDLVTVVTPPKHGLAVHATLAVRNDGAEPLKWLPLEVSSSLHWLHAAIDASGARKPLTMTQHCLETDADHTGAASEAILTLPEPLAPGKSLTVAVDYEGSIAADASRLTRVGATPEQAFAADWDAIGVSADASNSAAGSTPSMLVGLRGFGNVLWYPVAAPQLFLGNGAELFQTAGRMKLRDQDAPVRLRLTVDNGFEPAPAVAYFCGRRQQLRNAADPASGGEPSAVAEAEFKAEPLGFRALSLFVLPEDEQLITTGDAAAQFRTANPDASASSSSNAAGASSGAATPHAADATLLAVESAGKGRVPALSAAAGNVEPLLEQWLGPRPLTALTVVDHPGQAFEDGPLVVAPAEGLAVSTAAPALAHNLTHAWVQTGQPWMDEGLAQFFALLWTERSRGRESAVAQLNALMQPVAMADAAATDEAGGQPLIAATDEFFFRRKAAAVWWMLRDVAGADDLRHALEAWRVQPVSAAPPAEQAVAFEQLLEKLGHKDLGWFFNDWVLHDRGLPDLSIADVNAHPLDASNGARRGWLVTVTVHNDGAAQAEVPLDVRAGAYTNTKRIRVPAHGNATERVEMQNAPTEVRVNDGSVPEVRASLHTKAVNVNTH